MLRVARIDAEVHVIVSDNIVVEVRKRSRKVTVVFMVFDPPEPGSARMFTHNQHWVMEHLDTVIPIDCAGGLNLDV